MIKIGFDKKDILCRNFYFDDSEILTSNPPRYKVWYVDDENEFEYVLCSNVFVLKPAPKDKQKNTITPVKEIKQNNVKVKETTITDISDTSNNVISVNNDNQFKVEQSIEPETPVKKKPGRKKKETTPIIQTNEIRKFEYIVIDEDMRDVEDIQTMLNNYGKDGWELCGFEIYRDGFIKNSILCVLKMML